MIKNNVYHKNTGFLEYLMNFTIEDLKGNEEIAKHIEKIALEERKRNEEITLKEEKDNLDKMKVEFELLHLQT